MIQFFPGSDPDVVGVTDGRAYVTPSWRSSDAPPAAPAPKKPTAKVTPTRRRILDAIDGHMTVSEISEASGISRTTVHAALWRLNTAGLVRPCGQRRYQHACKPATLWRLA